MEAVLLFREHARLVRARRRARRVRRAGAWAAVLGAVGLGVAIVLAPPDAPSRIVPADGPIVVAAPEADAGPIDLRRDPIMLVPPESGTAATGTRRRLRFAGGSGTAAHFISDRMSSGAVELATTLPALPEDFATMSMAPPVPVAAGDAASSLVVRPEGMRETVAREFVAKLRAPRTLADHLRAVDPGGEAADAALQLLDLDRIDAGAVIASRTDRLDGQTVVVQLAVYDGTGVLGAIGRGEAGGFARIEDPWRDEGLAIYGGEDDADEPRLRVMDAIYATGIRNGVPPHVVSEAIVQMARAHDLGQLVEPDDRFRLLYSDEPRDGERGTGHVLYVSVTRGDDLLRCYVLRPGRDEGYTCMTERDTVSMPLGPAGTMGFVSPVDGVMRSRFGPRRHPILKRVRMHNGVDWAAPTGTPIRASLAGTVEFAGDAGGYGNVVRLAHPDGLQTRYAHMSRFADGIRRGRRVEAGEVIGYVGSTGLSTGPHLHFELRVRGEAVDPLGWSGRVERPAEAVAEATGRGEIDKLIARIIHVESGGRADAKNPRSTATGLGQFIDSTWLRMMRSYRPDLVATMSRRQLLNLRYEPAIAREMVYRLASENRASLRRAGQSATAGNLYLAHFLGPAGAVDVLRAPPDVPLVGVVGRGVIDANPFLRGKSADWVVRWAARKMNARVPERRSAPTYSQAPAVPEPVRVKNGRFAAYSEAIETMLASAEGRPVEETEKEEADPV